MRGSDEQLREIYMQSIADILKLCHTSILKGQ
jgi:hypothetical protein